MSTPNGKIAKIFKNPSRQQQPHYEKFTPNYRQMALEPVKHETRQVPRNTIVSSGGSRGEPSPSRNKVQSYASPTKTFPGNEHMVNVGNNMEQTWAGVDGEFVDDISDLDINQQMIDNNNYVDVDQPQTERDNFNIIEAINSADYQEVIVLVNNDVIFVGSLGDAQEVTKALVFGEHPYCTNFQIDPDDISCLLKMKIKTGVFIEV